MHIKTNKGHGYTPAMQGPERLHATLPFNIATGQAITKPDTANSSTYTNIFTDSLIAAMHKDESIVAVTAAMMGGTGLEKVKQLFPDRVMNVAIAEQHAVTLCSGMATCNLKPVCTLYSTFLQRAYDQVIHDVAIQNLPVRFFIDRAGVVGHDGPTHHGLFDLCFLRTLPNFVIMAPSNALDLARAVKTALAINNSPSAVRYPRAQCDTLKEMNWDDLETLPIGKANILHRGQKVAILSRGHMLSTCLAAQQQLHDHAGIMATLIDARFVKPMDTALLQEIMNSHEIMITVEDGASGGYGAAVAQYLMSQGYRGKFRELSHGSTVILQDSISKLYRHSGIDAEGIFRAICSLL